MGQPCKHMLILTKPIMNLMKLALALLVFTLATVEGGGGKEPCCKTKCGAPNAVECTPTSDFCTYTLGKNGEWTAATHGTTKKTTTPGQAEWIAGSLVCDLGCTADLKNKVELNKKPPAGCTVPPTTAPAKETKETKENKKKYREWYSIKGFCCLYFNPPYQFVFLRSCKTN